MVCPRQGKRTYPSPNMRRIQLMDRNEALKEDLLVDKALYVSVTFIQLGRGGCGIPLYGFFLKGQISMVRGI
ncbi:hypothetical protein NC653_022004 [Populus alba x Populus x berolinensis]|uniref:Uncharacterized protein n=1 Tax=Populus alba x Populus x berolinensis TaxID=444605 RepID=A0AAD6QFA3_9ROSI|nr:hypothetical protein NC653_022000 [Populus alba x Populus x berolinensis]KAJ6989293.1 hypothetical protein NC653_022004 [Populus alba x Populus x berolinensis]